MDKIIEALNRQHPIHLRILNSQNHFKQFITINL